MARKRCHLSQACGVLPVVAEVERGEGLEPREARGQGGEGVVAQ